jgi:hypothetical protein
MFALDLFNNDHERRLAEGAVDQLEQRRIDDLAMKMDDLVARAKDPAYKKNPAALAALMKEFQKCKAERDSYYMVRNETMGYGGLTSEAGIPGNVPTEKIPGKEDLLKGRGRSYYENDQKKNSELEEAVNPQFINVQAAKMLVTAGQKFDNRPAAEILAPLMKQYNLTVQQIDAMIPGGLKKLAGENGIFKEGFQDFNKVEPYAVCLAGKPVKKFDYYEQARRFHDNWKQKLYREGDKAKADTITLMPLNLDEPGMSETTAFLARAPKLSYGDSAEHATLGLVQVEKPMPDGSVVVYCKRDGKRYRTRLSVLKPAVAEGAMSNVHAAMADVYHRLAPKIERHRDSFLAGQLYDELENIAELHGIEPEFKRMMNGARNRAHMDYDTNPGGFQNWFWYLPFEEEELSEEQDTSGVERAILNRIMVAHTDLLMKFGPEKVMQAAEEVAYNMGDVDEIGTSDVSAYVNQVRQILGA